jgi:hypothetical protein
MPMVLALFGQYLYRARDMALPVPAEIDCRLGLDRETRKALHLNSVRNEAGSRCRCRRFVAVARGRLWPKPPVRGSAA